MACGRCCRGDRLYWLMSLHHSLLPWRPPLLVDAAPSLAVAVETASTGWCRSITRCCHGDRLYWLMPLHHSLLPWRPPLLVDAAPSLAVAVETASTGWCRSITRCCRGDRLYWLMPLHHSLLPWRPPLLVDVAAQRHQLLAVPPRLELLRDGVLLLKPHHTHTVFSDVVAVM